MRIEDYAVIGDTETTALVGIDGSIDWLCLPRFDSAACFAALLGTHDNGHWCIAPAASPIRTTRRYRPGTLVLETEFTTPEGVVRLIDCMPVRGQNPDVVRIVEGVSGRVPMHMDLVMRFDYGLTVPWVRRLDGGIRAIAGPAALQLRTPVPTRGEDLTTTADFSVGPGDRVPFVLTGGPSHLPPPDPIDAEQALAETDAWWREWSDRCRTPDMHREGVLRSLITLKALTYAPTGGIVAASTTSLPEQLGGVRNWDYRYCWLRDATFSLYSLMMAGYEAEAVAWRDWLLRAVAGAPSQLQILYGAAGERRLNEYELDWLAGYEGSRPVRVGNAASTQFQLDVYGEVVDSLYQARRAGIPADPSALDLEMALMEFLEGNWREPDEGIWEVRGPRRHFTHSKVMAWVAADRAARSIEEFQLPGSADRWRALGADIHAEVCAHGYDADRKTFTQSFDRPELDASLLMTALVGFLPASDDRVIGTVAAVQRHLVRDGFVYRYGEDSQGTIDGLPGGENAFLPCTFWLADNLILQGRIDEATAIHTRLSGLANDVGLLSEEYDPTAKRLMGNFPQAFTHVAHVNTCHNLAMATGPARDRADGLETVL
ncbi:MAG TPA: glycoside hydrolase family 15 protein [Acidimicrobiales bacterium]